MMVGHEKEMLSHDKEHKHSRGVITGFPQGLL